MPSCQPPCTHLHMMSNSNLIDLYRKLRPLQILFNDIKSVGSSVISHIGEDNSAFVRTNIASAPVTVLTYNLLSQHHINSEVYPYCTSGVLRSSYRTTRLISELHAYAPFHIAAFQEVAQFDAVWRKEFDKLGCEAVHAEKVGGRDGICLVYDRKRFQPLHHEVLSFAPLMTALEAIPNIAQILILADTDNTLLIVSNTHLFWRPDFDCLRVLQAHRLRKRIEELKSEYASDNNSVIFMCGDWNSDPKSAVYHLISGFIDRITRSHWQDLINSHSSLLKHPLESSQRLFAQVLEDFKKWSPLTSAYSFYKSPNDPAVRSEPPYTSINAYVDTLDYIFTDFKKVQVAELLMMPADEIVRGQTALPNEIYSSDHLALMAKFHFKQ